MLRVSTLLSLPLVFGAALIIAGCQKPADKSAPKENAGGKASPAAAQAESPLPNALPKDEGTASTNPMPMDTGTSSTNPMPMGEGVVKLTAADRTLIAKQKICPVSGQELGSMGDPIKVVVKGQTVFLCCPGCVDAIKKDPDKYLAKLKN